MATEMNLSDFTSSGTATSLKNLDDKGAFTIINVVDHPYEDQPGVKIFTAEKFNIGGTEYNEFYTTRKIIVEVLSKEELRNQLRDGDTLKVKIAKKHNKKGNHYFVLEKA